MTVLDVTEAGDLKVMTIEIHGPGGKESVWVTYIWDSNCLIETMVAHTLDRAKSYHTHACGSFKRVIAGSPKLRRGDLVVRHGGHNGVKGYVYEVESKASVLVKWSDQKNAEFYRACELSLVVS